MESSYQQQKLDNGSVRFTVMPASITRPRITTMWPGALLGGMIGAGLGPKQGFFSGVFLLAGAWLGWEAMARLMMYIAKRRWGTRGGSFVVSERGLETSTGSLIARDHLHRFVLKNAFPGLDDRVVVVGGGLAAQFGADNVARGAAYYATVANSSWNLCAEAGGRSTTLAGGMNDVTAHGLMTDVSKLLAIQVT
jgi:hypothetical protein